MFLQLKPAGISWSDSVLSKLKNYPWKNTVQGFSLNLNNICYGAVCFSHKMHFSSSKFTFLKSEQVRMFFLPLKFINWASNVACIWSPFEKRRRRNEWSIKMLLWQSSTRQHPARQPVRSLGARQAANQSSTLKSSQAVRVRGVGGAFTPTILFTFKVDLFDPYFPLVDVKSVLMMFGSGSVRKRLNPSSPSQMKLYK